MSTETEVASFLKDFNEKMKFWDVLFRDDRGKNAQALVDLELRPIERKPFWKHSRIWIIAKFHLKKNYTEVLICGFLAKPLRKRKCTSKLQWGYE